VAQEPEMAPSGILIMIRQSGNPGADPGLKMSGYSAMQHCAACHIALSSASESDKRNNLPKARDMLPVIAVSGYPDTRCAFT
jgi:hypothetical protein